jgi:NAD+ synthase
MSTDRHELTIDLSINEDLTRQLAVGFIREQTAKLGMNKVVLGLSGGIDSALCAYLAAEALGPKNVLGILMPYKTSAEDSIEDAMGVANDTGMEYMRFDITPMVEPLIESFPDMNRRRRGNIMARARMIVLYDQSVAFGPSLVLGTSNKTETLLGYFTVCGDGAAALKPIADLYKTQVRQLSRAMGVHEPCITKAPSAGLWPGQIDESDIGMTYEEMDQVLYLLVDCRCSPELIVSRCGFSLELVERMQKMVKESEFKRHTPLTAKLSSRTVGFDFLYPRDWSAR